MINNKFPSNNCCFGAIAEKKIKLPIKIRQFPKNVISPYQIGDHIELLGKFQLESMIYLTISLILRDSYRILFLLSFISNSYISYPMFFRPSTIESIFYIILDFVDVDEFCAYLFNPKLFWEVSWTTVHIGFALGAFPQINTPLKLWMTVIFPFDPVKCNWLFTQQFLLFQAILKFCNSTNRAASKNHDNYVKSAIYIYRVLRGKRVYAPF